MRDRRLNHVSEYHASGIWYVKCYWKALIFGFLLSTAKLHLIAQFDTFTFHINCIHISLNSIHYEHLFSLNLKITIRSGAHNQIDSRFSKSSNLPREIKNKNEYLNRFDASKHSKIRRLFKSSFFFWFQWNRKWFCNPFLMILPLEAILSVPFFPLFIFFLWQYFTTIQIPVKRFSFDTSDTFDIQHKQ